MLNSRVARVFHYYFFPPTALVIDSYGLDRPPGNVNLLRLPDRHKSGFAGSNEKDSSPSSILLTTNLHIAIMHLGKYRLCVNPPLVPL